MAGERDPLHSDKMARVCKAPPRLELPLQVEDLVHVPLPGLQERCVLGLDLPDFPRHATFEPIRFPAAIEEEHEGVLPAAEGNLVVLELDAAHATVAHRVERLIHEAVDRGEHRGDEVGVRVRWEPPIQVDHRRAAAIDEEDVLDDTAKEWNRDQREGGRPDGTKSFGSGYPR